MKKTLSILIVAIMLFILGCSETTPQFHNEIEEQIDDGIVIYHGEIISALTWQSLHEITITYVNNKTFPLIFGLRYDLQELRDTQWVNLENLVVSGWLDLGLTLAIGETYEENINLSEYGDLGAGQYRVVKHFSEDRMDEELGRLAEDVFRIEIIHEFSIER